MCKMLYNMFMSKIMVIADLHEKVRWVESMIRKESPDLVIQLGDVFDSFITTPTSVKVTCEWLLEFIDKPNHITLMGNHELAYRFPMVKHFWCSGNTMEKCELISNYIKYEHWEKLKLFHFDDHYLYSHAGISREHFEHPVNGITIEGIQQKCDSAINRAKSGGADPILRAGWSRGGLEKTGGLLWQDFNCEAQPVVGFHQIVGHTPVNSPTSGDIVKYVPNKKNPTGTIRVVDFKGRYYTIIENGQVRFKETGCEGYNERAHLLEGEPFINTKKIIELCKGCGEPVPCHRTHKIDTNNIKTVYYIL